MDILSYHRLDDGNRIDGMILYGGAHAREHHTRCASSNCMMMDVGRQGRFGRERGG